MATGKEVVGEGVEGKIEKMVEDIESWDFPTSGKLCRKLLVEGLVSRADIGLLKTRVDEVVSAERERTGITRIRTNFCYVQSHLMGIIRDMDRRANADDEPASGEVVEMMEGVAAELGEVGSL